MRHSSGIIDPKISRAPDECVQSREEKMYTECFILINMVAIIAEYEKIFRRKIKRKIDNLEFD